MSANDMSFGGVPRHDTTPTFPTKHNTIITEVEDITNNMIMMKMVLSAKISTMTDNYLKDGEFDHNLFNYCYTFELVRRRWDAFHDFD
jgi:hypothetical protein